MFIDDCKFTFTELATSILPSHMDRMRLAIAESFEMSYMGETRPRDILNELGRSNDFRGCYVLIENTRPFYVGISRRIVTRVRQHVNGRTHYVASLAYKIASTNYPHKFQREVAMEDPIFKAEFQAARDLLKSSHVAFIEIHNDLELYLFEAYCAMELGTSRWNTFRTH